MKTKFLFLFILLFFGSRNVFGQNTAIPGCSFNSAADVNNWFIFPANVSKIWFNGNCLAMFVDNLAKSQPAYITSPIFSIGSMGSYELEVSYGIIYTGNPAIFELVDNATNTVIIPVSVVTTAGTCPSWPNPKISKLNYSNVVAGNYRLRVTIPSASQFFLEAPKSNFNYTLATSESANHLDYTIYPNPTKDKIHFKDLKNISKVEVYDMTGKLVKSACDISGSLDISKLQEGIYNIKFFAGKEVYKSRLIKSR